MTTAADFCRYAPRLQIQYRYILRTREGQDMVRPDGTVYVFPSYMAAQRGRAMLNHRAFIIQQELSP